jgi:tetratricopeptide (TPR) repeat protein
VLDDASRTAADTALTDLQRNVEVSSAPFIYDIGRNRDCLTRTNEQLQNHAGLPPAYVSALWLNKGTAHYNLGEYRFALDALRRARDLIDWTDASRRILLGGGDQVLPTQDILQRSLIAMGFFDEAVETTERLIQTMDRSEKPFEVAWTLGVKCNLSALLGQNDVLQQDAAKIIAITEQHDYKDRRRNGLTWRGLARSRLGELDAGIADVREGLVTEERRCWLCDLLVQAGRLDGECQEYCVWAICG